jgi:hypothetical protein
MRDGARMAGPKQLGSAAAGSIYSGASWNVDLPRFQQSMAIQVARQAEWNTTSQTGERARNVSQSNKVRMFMRSPTRWATDSGC